MTTAFRLKTFPELLANMIARARTLLGDDIDLNAGSVFRTIFETAALNDADQYIQIGKLLSLRSIDDAKGSDLDALAKAYGSDFFVALRRRAARTSISYVVVGDGTLAASGKVAADVAAGSTTFVLDDASGFKSSGYLVVDQGNAQAETVVFSRVGNTIAVLSPSGGLRSTHVAGATVKFVSTRTLLASGVSIGAVSISLQAGTGAAWSSSGSVILDRGTSAEEKIAFTRVGDALTLSAPTAFAHGAGASAIQSTTNLGNRAVSAGLQPFVPATDATRQVNYRVTGAGGVLLDGDVASDLVAVESVDVGAQTLAGSNAITKWLAAPFAGATVTNPVAATRGSDREDDDTYRQRIKDFIQSLTRGTPLSLVTLTNGLEDPVSNRVVAFSSIVEPVSPGASSLFVTDGSADFSLSQAVFTGRDVLIRDARVGDTRGTLSQYGPYGYSTGAPVTPRLFKSVNRGSATSVGINFLEDLGQAMAPNAFVGMFLKTDDDQFYAITANTAIRFTLDAGGVTPSLGSYSAFNFATAPLAPGTDFAFNESTGDVELVASLVAHDGLVAASDGAAPGVGAYTYTTGLGAFVTRTVNGDPTDFNAFPGLRASGTRVVVKAPTIVSPSFVVKIVPKRGISDATAAASASTAIQVAVNAGGMGSGAVIAKIQQVCMDTNLLDDCTVISPTANVVVSKDQLVRIGADNLEFV